MLIKSILLWTVVGVGAHIGLPLGAMLREKLNAPAVPRISVSISVYNVFEMD